MAAMTRARVQYCVWETVSRVTGERRPLLHWFRDRKGVVQWVDLPMAHAIARQLTRQHQTGAYVEGEAGAVLGEYRWAPWKQDVIRPRRERRTP